MFISYYNLKHDRVTPIDMIMYKGHVKQCEQSGLYITVTGFRSETYVSECSNCPAPPKPKRNIPPGIVGTVYHLVIYMQSNNIHNVF